MDASIQRVKGNWVELVFIFLFFFNTFLLPDGLTYSLILTPVWIYLLHKTGKLQQMKYPLLLLLFYAAVHLYGGVELPYYLISSVLLLAITLFAITVAYYLQAGFLDLDYLFKRIVLLNFFFTLISLLFLFIPFLKPSVWYIMSMSDDVGVIPRLKLFTSEAAHYSYLLAPVAIWFYSQALFQKFTGSWPTLLLVSIPLLLSLSFGVLGCLAFSGFILILVHFKTVFNSAYKRKLLLFSIIGLTAIIAFLFLFYPENFLFVRLYNMTQGRDTSFRGRTYESFILAHKIVAEKSFWWGIGPGQLKVFGRDIIIQYYYYSRIPSVIRIPNAGAETIVCFGYVGFALRIGLEIFLFFYTKVFQSPYRLWLFLFLFLFQMMGSYITNSAEYVFWIFAFSPIIDKLIATSNNTSRSRYQTH